MPHTVLPRVLTVLVACAVAGSAAGADVIFSDGRIVSGDIVARNAEEIRLRIPLGTTNGEVTFPMERIARIDEQAGQIASQQIATIVAAENTSANASVEEWEALLARARAVSLPPLVRRCAEQILKRDRSRQDAASIAGMSKFRGVWMRPAEIATAQGQVLFEGRWMTWNDRAGIVAERARVAAEQVEAAKQLATRQAQLQAATQYANAVQAYRGDQINSLNSWQNSLVSPRYPSLWWNTNVCTPVWRAPSVTVRGSHSWNNSTQVTWEFNW